MTVKITGRGGGGGGSLKTIDDFRRSSAILPAGEAWYPAGMIDGQVFTTAQVIAVNNLLMVPFFTAQTILAKQIGFRLSANGGAGSVTRVGVYSNLPATMYPGALLFDSGSTATDAGAPVAKKFALPANFTIAGGSIVWLALLTGVAGPTLGGLSNVGGSGLLFGFDTNLNLQQTGLFVAFAFAALPNPFPAGGAYLNVANVPLIALQL